MMTTIKSMGLLGMNAYLVVVEVDFLRALPSFDIVGLPDTAIKESRDRVRFAMKNSGYPFPEAKVTVNLAPADVKKRGPFYDVPICLAILSVMGAIEVDTTQDIFLGELSLNGELRPIVGALPMTIQAKEMGFQRIFVPEENASEAGIVKGISVYGIRHINQLIRFLEGSLKLEPLKPHLPQNQFVSCADFSEVKGQAAAKRALEIAAAGGHNALLIGSPGSGKSMLAKRIPSILPDMSFEESIECSKIHSVAGTLKGGEPLITIRPFRAPHHTISPVGLSGGGSIPRPGEISLAHHGVLFLDELPEFSRSAMEVLRQPLEDGTVTISRASGTLSYPCSMMVIAAMNPCPCGYFGHPSRKCTCSTAAVKRYLSRVSGPLLDRLDLHIDVMPVEFESLSSTATEEPSCQIKNRVNHVRALQRQRFEGTNILTNAQIQPAMLSKFCPIDSKAMQVLKGAFEKLGLSARAYDRIVKVSRTIADLDNSEVIGAIHVAEAIQYRSLDRKYWNH